ncbi:MAG: hypothetical protein ACJ790_09380 [Myxococcaceae bacterium]
MKRLLVLSSFVLCSSAFAADAIDLSLAEFKMYRHWQAAMADARVQKMKPEARDPAIAKDAKYKLKDMQAAVQKGEAAGDLKAKCEGLLKEAFDAGPAKGLVRKVDVDATVEHAVAYVEWANENIQNAEEEASVLAAQTKACPILSSVQLWATDKSNPKARVWQGLIAADAAAKINVERAKDFADSRYIKLFEKVKNVANGDDLSADGTK